jgi:putative AlgH/UPF0301 family transcriptional regulator
MSLRKLCFFVTLSTFAVVGSVNRLALNNRAQPTPLLSVQSRETKNLSVGSLLVASRDLGDPNFAQTVVLLIRYDPQGVIGLILNRRTEVPVSRVLKDFKAAQDRSDRVYLGGPVDTPTVFGLCQSPAKIEGADHVFDKVYLISAKPVFERALSAQPDPGIFHVYLGYGGWNRDQLQREVELGSWFIFPADANTVFSSDPDSLWPQMIRKTELKFAGRPASGLIQPANILLKGPAFPSISKRQVYTHNTKDRWMAHYGACIVQGIFLSCAPLYSVGDSAAALSPGP